MSQNSQKKTSKLPEKFVVPSKEGFELREMIRAAKKMEHGWPSTRGAPQGSGCCDSCSLHFPHFMKPLAHLYLFLLPFIYSMGASETNPRWVPADGAAAGNPRKCNRTRI